MTANDFRKLALGLADVIESAHMDHPDFRVGGKIFATLGYPDASWAMVSLRPVLLTGLSLTTIGLRLPTT